MLKKKLTFFHAIPSLEVDTFLYIEFWACPNHQMGSCPQLPSEMQHLILHIATTGPMHYAPHIPVSHGGSNANAMQ